MDKSDLNLGFKRNTDKDDNLCTEEVNPHI